MSEWWGGGRGVLHMRWCKQALSLLPCTLTTANGSDLLMRQDSRSIIQRDKRILVGDWNGLHRVCKPQVVCKLAKNSVSFLLIVSYAAVGPGVLVPWQWVALSGAGKRVPMSSLAMSCNIQRQWLCRKTRRLVNPHKHAGKQCVLALIQQLLQHVQHAVECLVPVNPLLHEEDWWRS